MRRLFVTVVVAMALGLLPFVCPAEAQTAPDLTLWNNTLWKLTTDQLGYYFSSDAVNNFTAADGIVAQSASQWGRVTADQSGAFSINIYYRGDGGVCVLVETLDISYVAGSQLGFVGTYDIASSDTHATGLMYVSGKLDKDGMTIKSGKIQPLGQYVMDSNITVPPGGDRGVAKVEFKGNKVTAIGCGL